MTSNSTHSGEESLVYKESHLNSLILRIKSDSMQAGSAEERLETDCFLSIVRYLDYSEPDWKQEIVNSLNKAGVSPADFINYKFDLQTLTLSFGVKQIGMNPFEVKRLNSP